MSSQSERVKMNVHWFGTYQEIGLCLNRTNGKDSSEKLTLTLNLRLTLSLTLKKETKKRNLKKEEKKREPSGFELQKSKTNRSACDNPTNRVCHMVIRYKLPNFLAFYNTTRD